MHPVWMKIRKMASKYPEWAQGAFKIALRNDSRLNIVAPSIIAADEIFRVKISMADAYRMPLIGRFILKIEANKNIQNLPGEIEIVDGYSEINDLRIAHLLNIIFYFSH